MNAEKIGKIQFELWISNKFPKQNEKSLKRGKKQYSQDFGRFAPLLVAVATNFRWFQFWHVSKSQMIVCIGISCSQEHIRTHCCLQKYKIFNDFHRFFFWLQQIDGLVVRFLNGFIWLESIFFIELKRNYNVVLHSWLREWRSVCIKRYNLPLVSASDKRFVFNSVELMTNSNLLANFEYFRCDQISAMAGRL